MISLSIAPIPVCAQEPAVSSGVYILAVDPLQMSRGDGTVQLPLGEKVAARFDHAALVSDTNDNSHCRIYPCRSFGSGNGRNLQ
jgi:hypothetical protein